MACGTGSVEWIWSNQFILLTPPILSQKICDQPFFFFQLVDIGGNFAAAELIQRHVLNNLPRVAHSTNGERTDQTLLDAVAWPPVSYVNTPASKDRSIHTAPSTGVFFDDPPSGLIRSLAMSSGNICLFFLPAMPFIPPR
jgi:hypothetical protein